MSDLGNMIGIVVTKSFLRILILMSLVGFTGGLLIGSIWL